MKLTCRRCDYEWNTKKETKPRVCPRCKSKKWESVKSRPWEKTGQLYVVQLKKGIVSVGQTTVGQIRMRGYSGVVSETFSGFLKDLNKCEQWLIGEAKKLCGEPTKGRECFSGSEEDFKVLSELLTKKYGKHDDKEEGKDSFDFLKMACQMAIEENTPIVIAIKKSDMLLAKHNMLVVGEAMADADKGICTHKKALESLATVFSDTFMERVAAYEEVEDGVLVNKYDDLIHEVVTKPLAY